jgi:hypothetical protein
VHKGSLFLKKITALALYYALLNFAAIFRNVIQRSSEFEQVIKVWIGPKLIVFLVDPRDVEVILSSHVYIDKSTEYRFFQPWLGDGLLISTGRRSSCMFLLFLLFIAALLPGPFKWRRLFKT